MPVAWPTDRLPLPLLANYGEKEDTAIDATEFESGSPRYRNRFTQNPLKVNIQLFIQTAEQLTFFWTFYLLILKRVNTFTVPLLGRDGVATTQTARFTKKKISVTTFQNKYKVSAELILDKRGIYTQAEYDNILINGF